jgi:putative membrane protein
MKTLVLCVDRDDDLGTKAGVSGPVIGREENVMAAQKLGLADPEDVDTNSMLSAVSLYDDLVKKGISAEIATITGDIHVGFQSDLILTRQLENLLELVKPDRAILVSDGEEDEHIYPMVSSRVKIDSVKRVFVKQSESLEGFYYLLVHGLKDAKVRSKWVLPVALILIIIGMLYLALDLIRFGESGDLNLVPEAGVYSILIVLGFYLIWWAFEFGHKLRRLRGLVRQGSLSIPFALVGILLIIFGLFLGYDSVSAYTSTLLPDEVSWALAAVIFVEASIWPIILAIFSIETGRAIMTTLHRGRLKWSSLTFLISVMAIGFIVQGVADGMRYFLVQDSQSDLIMITSEIIIGVGVAIFGAVLSASMRGANRPDKERISS